MRRLSRRVTNVWCSVSVGRTQTRGARRRARVGEGPRLRGRGARRRPPRLASVRRSTGQWTVSWRVVEPAPWAGPAISLSRGRRPIPRERVASCGCPLHPPAQAERARPSTRSPTQARSLTTTSLGEHAAMLSLRSPAAVEYPSEVPDSRHRVTAHPDPDSTSPRRDGRAPARCLASLG